MAEIRILARVEISIKGLDSHDAARLAKALIDAGYGFRHGEASDSSDIEIVVSGDLDRVNALVRLVNQNAPVY